MPTEQRNKKDEKGIRDKEKIRDEGKKGMNDKKKGVEDE
jgi:hypothetical protein